jgi:phosphoribosylformylglycinamidine (FGAM) synthase-like amidotransferase family enzyme
VGLLPGVEGAWPARAPAPSVALADNVSDRFEDRWSRMEIPPATRCVWTAGLAERFGQETLMFPSAHGEGRFVASDETIGTLEAGGQVAIRYAEGDNFNGSAGRIAGICDPSGRIFGLMPHPERYLSWAHHPWATRLERGEGVGDTPGLAVFRNAVEAVRGARVA